MNFGDAPIGFARSTFTILLTTLLMAVTTPRLDGQDADVVTRIVDISGLVTPILDAPVVPWRLPIDEAYSDSEPRERNLASTPRVPFTMDQVVMMLRTAIAPKSWSDDRTTLTPMGEGAHLLVRHDKDVVERVVDFVASFTRVVRHPIEVEGWVLRGDSVRLAEILASGPILDARRVAAMRSSWRQANIVVDRHVRVRAVDTQRLRLETGRLVHFCGDYDVEVAPGAQSVDPTVRMIFEGLDLAVRPTLTLAGKIDLRLQGRLASRLELASVRPKSPVVGGLQLPKVAVQMFASTVSIESGGGVIIGALRSTESEARVLVLAARTSELRSPAIGEGARWNAIYPLRHITAPRAGLAPLFLGQAAQGRRRDEGRATRRTETPFARSSTFIEADRVFDMVRTQVNPKAWDDFSYRLELVNGRLFASATSTDQREIRDLLATLTTKRADHVAAEVHVLSVVGDVDEDIKPAQRARALLRSTTSERLHSAFLVAEIGGSAHLACGREFAYLGDYDVKIAERAYAGDPVVRTGFAGLYLRLAPFAVGSDAFGVHFGFDFSGRDPTVTDFGAGSGEYGLQQLPTVPRVAHVGQVISSANNWTILHEASDPSFPERRLIVVARFSRS